MSVPKDNSNAMSEAKKNTEDKCQITNMEKYKNYKTQLQRLKRAMDSKFYLEAIVIEYAIMEDRMKSILSHEGNENIPWKISEKINRIKRHSKQNILIGRYFANDLKGKRNLLDEIVTWLNNNYNVSNNSVCRNSIIHNLLGIITTTDKLCEMAKQGKILCKDLCNRANCYKRMLERRNAKQEIEEQ